MGGLDIFRSTFSNGEWSKPVNLQVPINSPGDDFAIIFNPEEDAGFFSSNRKGGRGSDDIYSFVNPPVLFTLSGVVKDDKTLQFVPGAVVKLTGSNGTSVEARTDVKGHYSFNKAQIKPNTTYELICMKENYLNKKAKETTVGLESSKDFTIDFNLEPIPDKPVVLPDILYDLAKWDLKPQYQDSLQGLIKTLDENETIIIELASHTDSRGTDESNDILSQKRAESVVNYLIARGIDPDRLVAKGYGERVPRRLAKDVVKDGFEFKAGTLLSQAFVDSLPSKPEQEAAYALNRRTEFRIISKDFVPKTQNKVMTSQIPTQAPTSQAPNNVVPSQAKNDSLPVQAQNNIIPAQTQNNAVPKVVIQINPDDNVVQCATNADNLLTFSAVVNGYTTQITLSEEGPGLSFSEDATLKMLKSGAIGKTDFAGDAEKILGNNSIADKAIFTVGEINIATKSVFDLEATVLKNQKAAVLMSEKVLKRFGTYSIDKEKKQIIFK
jgi:peptidoglycan-associated lipoprotein